MLSGIAYYKHDEDWELQDFIIQEYTKMESTSIVDAVEAIKPFLVQKYDEIDDMEEHFRSMRN